MKHKVLYIGGLLFVLLGALMGIERRTVNPVNGPSRSEIRLLMPGQKPAFETIPEGGTSLSQVRYAYGLLPGGIIDPKHVEMKLQVQSGSR